MKRIKLIFILFFIAAFVVAQGNTQIELPRQTESIPKYAISIMPQYAIVGGMRFDFDINITPKNSLTLAPVFYYKENTYMYDPENTSFKGVGAFVNYRYFPSGKGVYAGLGLNYRFLSTDYYKYDDDDEMDAKFNTMGFDVLLGYQFRMIEQLFMDIYIGWGFRYTDQEIEKDEDNDYWSGAILDLGYSGFLPVAGLRIGFEF